MHDSDCPVIRRPRMAYSPPRDSRRTPYRCHAFRLADYRKPKSHRHQRSAADCARSSRRRRPENNHGHCGTADRYSEVGCNYVTCACATPHASGSAAGTQRVGRHHHRHRGTPRTCRSTLQNRDRSAYRASRRRRQQRGTYRFRNIAVRMVVAAGAVRSASGVHHPGGGPR